MGSRPQIDLPQDLNAACSEPHRRMPPPRLPRHIHLACPFPFRLGILGITHRYRTRTELQTKKRRQPRTHRPGKRTGEPRQSAHQTGHPRRGKTDSFRNRNQNIRGDDRQRKRTCELRSWRSACNRHQPDISLYIEYMVRDRTLFITDRRFVHAHTPFFKSPNSSQTLRALSRKDSQFREQPTPRRENGDDSRMMPLV